MRFNIHLFIYDLTLWNIFYRIPCRNHNIRHRYMVLFFFTDHFCGGFSSHVVMSDISTDFGISPSTRPPVIIIIFFPSRIFDETPAISSLFCMKSPFSFAKNIHGKRMIDIGCRCYDRHCTDPFCKQSCKFICSAIMSGQNRDNKLSLLVHHQNRMSVSLSRREVPWRAPRFRMRRSR